MAIFAECDCGHMMKLPESAGGKRIRCPECSGPISVPAGRRQASYDDYDDDGYGDDGYGDDDWDDAPRRPSRSPRSGGSRRPPRTRPVAPKRSKKKAKQDSGLGVGLAIGIGGIVLLAGVVFGVIFLLSDKDDAGNNVAQANNGTANNTTNTTTNTNTTPNTTNPGNTPPNVGQNNNNAGQNNSNANSSTVSAKPNGSLWAVVSNFKSVNAGIGAFNKSYSIDYRLVSGTVPAGTQIVLYISEGSSGIVEHYNEVNISMKSSGSVSFQLGPTFGPGRLEAHLAIKQGYQKWKPISGKVSVGGGQSTAEVPKTLAQQAGNSGVGKAIVLGNARKESDFGQTAYVVDYQIQQKPSGGYYFCVIKDGSGQGIEFDVSSKIRLSKNGEEGTLGGKPLGLDRLSGQITAHIEKRSTPLPSRFGTRRNGPAPTIVSNTVTFK